MRDVASLFKALGDEARVQMVWLLLHHDELCVCDFMAALDVGQSKASRHLRTLYHAGLVSDRRAGTWTYYSLHPQAEGLARSQLEALRSSLHGRADAEALLRATARYLEEKTAAGCGSQEEQA